MSDSDRADAFRGVAHPLRRKILRLLDQQEHTVSELLGATGAQATAMSQHLAVLRETGLVTHRTRGPRRYYRLKRSALRRVITWANQFK